MEKRHEVRLGARYLFNGELMEVVSFYNGYFQLRGVNHKGVINLLTVKLISAYNRDNWSLLAVPF